MKDRLYFKETKLRNGITIYSREEDVPFLEMEIIIPVGSAHNLKENKAINGMAHFLEHAIFERSKNHPNKKEFERFITLSGGYLNARTGPEETTFEASVPASLSEAMVEGFLDHIFNPLFVEEDFKLHRNIIRDERKKKDKYYPGQNEIGCYLLNDWMNSRWYELEQALGSDEDLALINPESIKDFHKYYFNDGIKVIVGGKFDLGHLKSHFSKIETKHFSLKKRFSDSKWTKQKFHKKTFKDITRPVYFRGGIVDKDLLPEEKMTLTFIFQALTNIAQGPLYHWVREEKGWSYYVSYNITLRPKGLIWWLEIPIQMAGAEKELRRDITSKIESSLKDKSFLDREVDRQIYKSLFYYQKISERIDDVSGSLSMYGKIFLEKDFFNMLDKCRDPKYVMKIYRKYLDPKKCGEVLALPES